MTRRNDNQPPKHGAAGVEAISRGLGGVSIGLASVALAAMTSIPALLNGPSPVAALYAEALMRGFVGALGAGVMAVVFWMWGYEARMGTPKSPSGRRYDIVAVSFVVSGLLATLWGGMGLLGLAIRLPGAAKGV